MSSASRSSFTTLPLSPALISNLSDLGYEHLTDIQAAALPELLKGKDMIGQAKTGSGKTAAFGLCVLNNLRVEQFRIQCLVMCPTRELANQVAGEIRKLGRVIHNIKVLTLCGGMPFGPQIGSLEHGAHIIVGTPGRIDEHIRKGNLKLENVHTLVLDEADRMLDMGFQEAVEEIIHHLPEQRQTLLFSATFPASIKKLSARVMANPVMVKVDSHHQVDSIQQHFIRIEKNDSRPTIVESLIRHHQPNSVIVFCNTKADTNEVAAHLRSNGLSALALHGDLEQRDRDQALICFSNNSLSILVATDVAARGLDIDKLDLVINYQLARETEVHIHRVGRTGRAGESGIAYTLVSDTEDYKLAKLAELTQKVLTKEAAPTSRKNGAPKPTMVTLQIDGGKKQKLRPGDIVGALTRDGLLAFDSIGKINVMPNHAYVAVAINDWKTAYKQLDQGKLKGRNFRVRKIDLT